MARQASNPSDIGQRTLRPRRLRSELRMSQRINRSARRSAQHELGRLDIAMIIDSAAVQQGEDKQNQEPDIESQIGDRVNNPESIFQSELGPGNAELHSDQNRRQKHNETGADSDVENVEETVNSQEAIFHNHARPGSDQVSHGLTQAKLVGNEPRCGIVSFKVPPAFLRKLANESRASESKAGTKRKHSQISREAMIEAQEMETPTNKIRESVERTLARIEQKIDYITKFMKWQAPGGKDGEDSSDREDEDKQSGSESDSDGSDYDDGENDDHDTKFRRTKKSTNINTGDHSTQPSTNDARIDVSKCRTRSQFHKKGKVLNLKKSMTDTLDVLEG